MGTTAKFTIFISLIFTTAACGNVKFQAIPHSDNLTSNAPITDATPTPTPSWDATPTPAPTATATPAPTATPTATPWDGPTPTPVPTATATPTPKPTPTATATPVPTPKPTATPVPTPKPTPTPTPSTGDGDCVQVTLWSDRPTDMFFARFCKKGDRIVGDTFWGEPIINLQITGGHYLGWAGGQGNTEMTCTATDCNGWIGGNTSYWKMTSATGSSTRIEGSINFYHTTLVRTPKSIEITTSGSGEMRLDNLGDGTYDGEADWFNPDGTIHQMRAMIESSGALKDVPDDVLLTIILGGPLATRDTAEAGVDHVH